MIGRLSERWAGAIGLSVHSFARGGASSTGGVVRLQERSTAAAGRAAEGHQVLKR